MPRCTYEVVASPLHDRHEIDRLLGPVATALERAGAARQAPSVEQPHLVVVGTGGSESAVIDCLDRVHLHLPGMPAVLLAHPKHNSLPAALEALALLQQQGRRGRIVFVAGNPGNPRDPGDPDDTVDAAVRDLTTWYRFRRTRLGLVGTPSDWLVASTPSAETVARRWGPELVDVSIPETIEAFHDVPVEIGRTIADRFGGVHAPTLPAPQHVGRAGRLEPALRRMIDEHQLDAVTVRCFDFLGSIETSGCMALAQLNDAGIVAGCEGDVPAALAMLWARYLLDQPGWIANPAAVDVDANRLVLAHCTIAPSMVDDLQLSSHFESGIGVGVHGRLRSGEVTVIRVGGADLDRCWIAEGMVSRSGSEPDLCRTQATIDLRGRSVGELLDAPLGNHLVLVEGAHRQRLERWFDWAVAVNGT